MKYLIYTRISPRGSDFDKTAENSTVMQREACEKYVSTAGGTVSGVLTDEFVSGKDLNRPQMKALIDSINDGTADWDVLCVYNMSRLTRSPKDMYFIFDLLSRNRKKFLSIREPEFDYTDPAKEMLMGIISHVNQYMRKSSADLVRQKMFQIAEHGGWPVGNPPFGYRRGEKKDNTLYVDPEKAAIVRDIFQRYAEMKELSCREMCMKYRGIIAHSQIYRILDNVVYLGRIPYGDKVFPGKHEPIISEQLFNEVQKLRPEKKNGYHIRPKTYNSYFFLLSGLLYCECGLHLTPGTAKSGKFAYYTCYGTKTGTCNRRISAPKIEEAVLSRLKEIQLDERYIKAAIREYTLRKEEEFNRKAPDLTGLKKAKKAILSEKEIVMKILLSSELTSHLIAELNSKIENLNTRLEAVEIQISAIEQMKPLEENLVKAGLDFLVSLKKFSDLLEGTQDRKTLRTLLPLYIKKITVLKTGEFKIELADILSSPNCKEWWAICNLVISILINVDGKNSRKKPGTLRLRA